MSEAKRFTRIVTDAAGGSAFQDDEFSLAAPPGVTGMLTGTVPAASAVVYVRHDMFDFPPGPRPAPRRQWVVVLRGAVDVEVTDGSRRTFGPGDFSARKTPTAPGTSHGRSGTRRSKGSSCPADGLRMAVSNA
jgi:hypothetical protein